MSSGIVATFSSCILPSETGAGTGIAFSLEFETPLRIPIAATVIPAIGITSGGEALLGARIRLESLDTAIANIDSTDFGIVGVARGQTNLRAVFPTAAAGVQVPDTLFPVQVIVGSVDVIPQLDTLSRVGDTVQFVAMAQDANENIVPAVNFTWSSSDPEVANVTSSGVATATSDGIATITAESDGVIGASTLVVDQNVTTVQVVPDQVSFTAVSRRRQITALAFDEDGLPVTPVIFLWSASDIRVATVDPTGLITATGPGASFVVARVGGVRDTAAVVVNQVPAFVFVTPPTASLTAIDDVVQLSATAADSAGAPIQGFPFTWTSSDSSVATVGAAGLVTALVPSGTVTATATTGALSGAATVIIQQVAASVQVSPPSVTLTSVGETAQFSATAFDKNQHLISDAAFMWTTSNQTVAVVDTTGLVTAVGNGGATITAVAGGGAVGNASVLVQTSQSAPPR